jgi:hypothetical protein
VAKSEPQEPQDHKAQQDLQVDPLVPQVLRVPLDHKAPQVLQVLEPLVQLAHKVPPAILVFLEHRVLLEPPEPQD